LADLDAPEETRKEPLAYGEARKRQVTMENLSQVKLVEQNTLVPVSVSFASSETSLNGT